MAFKIPLVYAFKLNMTGESDLKQKSQHGVLHW